MTDCLDIAAKLDTIIERLPALKARYPFYICASWPNVPPNGGERLFDGMPVYSDGRCTWSFPVTVSEDKNCFITDMLFQSKAIRLTDIGFRNKSSYAQIDSVWTLTEHAPVAHFVTPIKLGPGFVLTGKFINQSPEPQNMIIRIHGYMEPI